MPWYPGKIIETLRGKTIEDLRVLWSGFEREWAIPRLDDVIYELDEALEKAIAGDWSRAEFSLDKIRRIFEEWKVRKDVVIKGFREVFGENGVEYVEITLEKFLRVIDATHEAIKKKDKGRAEMIYKWDIPGLKGEFDEFMCISYVVFGKLRRVV
ncbi:hypothetical protein DRJ16_02600 [Candidatus Woesearchaeota archaeon]|nr:MAG: hypothetical protein DRJ16_02600 [Candidatus Woesearchaeota archaeon]